MTGNSDRQACVKEALCLLGVDRLALAIHDQSFPSRAEDELGRGTPYGAGGYAFLHFAANLGFNCLQLGPQGKTSLGNPSPYDSTIFSRNELSINLRALCADPELGELLQMSYVDELVDRHRQQGVVRNFSSYKRAYQAIEQALSVAFLRFDELVTRVPQVSRQLNAWLAQNVDWLDRDCLFEVKDSYNVQSINLYKFQQFVVHKQHERFRQAAAQSGVKLYADMQVGFSQRDLWSLREILLSDYLLGAPPSRTNPDGQPWGYPVLNPALYFASDERSKNLLGPSARLFIERVDKLLGEFDGIRIDHPHGLVCPWVYKAGESDQLKAVQNGARLFESPAAKEHPLLRQFAIVSSDQLAKDEGVPPYADSYVKDLTEAQVERYGFLISLIHEQVARHGLSSKDIICEVLSSCPYPLKAVLEHFGLGRFRVTTKANPQDTSDGYLSINARPPDWIMVGTHDTRPLRAVVDDWSADLRQQWSLYLASRLEADQNARAELCARLAANKEELIEAMFADLFLGPASNVSIFFADLFGMKDTYNKPGIIDDTNWMLSVPADFEALYNERCSNRQALNLPKVLALALKAKHSGSKQGDALIKRLAEL